MPDLNRLLADYDLALLRQVAALWGLELHSGTAREAAEELARLMRQAGHVGEVVAGLPAPARAALQSVAGEGRVLLATFTRRHGELRAMGPARRERERPWENAPSTTEVLWYRGLIGRAFFDDGRGPEEFVFIPDDLRPLLPLPAAPPVHSAPPGTPAPEPAHWEPAAGAAADDAATLLAYIQVTNLRVENGRLPVRHASNLGRFLRQPAALEFYLHLLLELGLAQAANGPAPSLPVSGPLKLDPERTQPFLQASRAGRVQQLAEAWRASRTWNDLLHVPGLVFEGGAWRNDPVATRQALLGLLAAVPVAAWWSLDAFAAAVKERQPDFQRPAGDYDSWYIRDAGTKAYLRGFEHWDRVEGALVRWVVRWPLFWLGLVEVAGPATGPAAFRVTPYGAAFLGHGQWEAVESAAPAVIELQPDGTLCAPAAASAHERFQLARITDWLPPEGAPADLIYRYRLTPAALARAERKGISVMRILQFLERTAPDHPALPGLSAALRRWERSGREAVLREVVVLQLSSADLLETLRRTPGIREYLGQPIGPTAITVRREHIDALRAALVQVGLLADE